VIEYRDATLLLRGESGTGKNHVARVIHFNGGRAEGRFVDINCASIPDQLLESELFGYEKGAFTDARAAKKGLFEVGHKGTVLLDEINAMSPALQAKLLSVLEQHSFRRLGSTEEMEVDVRVITTTNVQLEDSVSQRDFREDLYYRINVVSIEIPPLRERSDDIEPLALHFLGMFNKQFGKNIRGLTRSALAALKTYRWPGNIRELRNVVEHGMIFTDTPDLDSSDLVLGKSVVTQRDVPARPRICSIQDVEKDHIESILLHTGGDTVKAAEILGISRKTLWEKRKKYGFS
jgi:transcriptional regulator with PAS, ATPase and Fis domain